MEEMLTDTAPNEMFGRTGNDFLAGDRANDRLDGGPGFDSGTGGYYDGRIDWITSVDALTTAKADPPCEPGCVTRWRASGPIMRGLFDAPRPCGTAPIHEIESSRASRGYPRIGQSMGCHASGRGTT
jgi:hypothetical protein